jgi:hypothetical protein
MPALIASHNIKTVGEQINDLTLPFVAPLSANNNYDHK